MHFNNTWKIVEISFNFTFQKTQSSVSRHFVWTFIMHLWFRLDFFPFTSLNSRLPATISRSGFRPESTIGYHCARRAAATLAEAATIWGRKIKKTRKGFLASLILPDYAKPPTLLNRRSPEQGRERDRGGGGGEGEKERSRKIKSRRGWGVGEGGGDDDGHRRGGRIIVQL